MGLSAKQLSWTPERREAQRQRMLGKTRVISEQTRAKISATLTGRKTGYVMTPHHRAVMATRRGVPSGFKGVPKPPDFGAKVSVALKGRPKSEQHRAKLCGKRPDWVRLRMSEGCRNRTAEEKQQHIDNFKASLTTDSRARISAAHKGKKRSPECRAKMVEVRARAKYPFNNSKPEIAVCDWLTANGVQFIKHARLPFYPLHAFDIAIPEVQTAVEIDGCYWHGCPDHYLGTRQEQAARDVSQMAIATDNGWKVIRLWEHEIKSGDFSKLSRLTGEQEWREL